MSIKDAFESYQRDVIAFRNQSPKTEEMHKLACKHLTKFLGNKPIQELTFIDVRNWNELMTRERKSVLTRRGYLIKLRVVLDYMNDLGIECLNKKLVRLPKRAKKSPIVLSAEQVEILIRSAGKTRTKAVIALLYSSGIRVSELCALDRDQIQKNYFSVFGKGNKSRPCFIDSRARRLLNNYLVTRDDPNPALFINRLTGRRLQPVSIQEMVRFAAKRAGFNFTVTPHTLRHSFATNLMINGCHIYPLSRMLGHESIATTEIYLTVYDAELQEAHNKYHTVA